MTKARHTGFARLTQQEASAAAARHETLHAGRLGGARAVFIFCDLSGLDLSGRNLADADFTGAVLEDANLAGAKLDSASFFGADLRRSNLSGASMRRAASSQSIIASAGSVPSGPGVTCAGWSACRNRSWKASCRMPWSAATP